MTVMIPTRRRHAAALPALALMAFARVAGAQTPIPDDVRANLRARIEARYSVPRG